MSELNVVRKDFKDVEIKIALCYPNLYQAGIACYGIQLVYSIFNSFKQVQCERFYYTPRGPLVSEESGQALSNFDVICFSFQYELDYLNMLSMLSRAKIQLYSEKRTAPLVIAGGPCVLENPLPLSPFIDIFVLGDLEPIAEQLITSIIDYKNGKKSLTDFRDISGLFIPREYDGERICKLTAKNLDECFHPTYQLVSEQSPFGKSLALEVSRGCPRGCKFCLIGYQGLPVRSRSLSPLKQIIIKGIEHSRVKKITLIGSSLSDYPHLKELCEFIAEQGLQCSFPSMRLEVLSDTLLEHLHSLDVQTLSIAPETGSERLRDVIGKPVQEDVLLDCITRYANAKIPSLKLYFLIGLPTETLDDVTAIPNLLSKLTQIYSPPSLQISINPFVPKPHTPFQWVPPIDLSYLQNAIKIIQKQTRALKIYNPSFLDPRWARIQGLLSRGNRDLGNILVEVMNQGRSLGAWRRVIKDCNFSIKTAQNFPAKLDDELPWDFIDVNVEKRRLLSLYQPS
ncbi:MAG: radical SAM protein [Promethearchaeota archaeon]|nr:MAG: radical SAM protein [Candidatus Lokiarchaeota archaeon]